jgi:hypothetical protein
MQKSTSSLIWTVFTAVMISILVVFAMFSFSACRVLKRHTKTEITKDSTVLRKDTSTLVKISSNTTRIRRESDSTIGIPGTWIRFITIDAGKDTVIRKGALQLRQYRNQDGHQVTECSSDSLTLVIKRLIQDSIVISERYDSLARQYDYTYKAKERISKEYKLQVPNTRLYLAVLILLTLCYIAYKILR